VAMIEIAIYNTITAEYSVGGFFFAFSIFLQQFDNIHNFGCIN